jgi:ATP-dependent exoDNAse (exonuclease V) beta subunit
MPVGAEQQIVNEALGLTGRIDLLELENDQVIIRDLKTGNVRDANGTITQHISFQMRLYGLLARAIFPDKAVRSALSYTPAKSSLTGA